MGVMEEPSGMITMKIDYSGDLITVPERKTYTSCLNTLSKTLLVGISTDMKLS